MVLAFGIGQYWGRGEILNVDSEHGEEQAFYELLLNMTFFIMFCFLVEPVFYVPSECLIMVYCMMYEVLLQVTNKCYILLIRLRNARVVGLQAYLYLVAQIK